MKKSLAGNEKGFTLIELIVVIVILGILAAVAVPKYMDLTTEAYKATANGVFAAARGAATLNFAKNLAGGNVPAITKDGGTVGSARLKALLDVSSEIGLTEGNDKLTITVGGTSYDIGIVSGEVLGTNPSAAVLTKSGTTW